MKLSLSLLFGLMLVMFGCVSESNHKIDDEDVKMKEVREAKLSRFEGAIVRGPKDEKVMTFVFTGGSYGEGMPYILETLKKHGIKGAFFFTGDFLENAEFEGYVKQAYSEGHYVGPHSYGHPLYCDWGDRSKTLISREDFEADFEKNLKLIEEKYAIGRNELKWWIPPYEHYNKEVAGWAEELGYPMFNLTYGTLTHADYTLANAKNYRDSETIWKSVFEYEAKHEDGLNGWIMLIHAGAGDGRPDKFFLKLDDLINELKGRGYSFVRVDEMIEGK
ncbi:polysaccharide deacetylase family protein [Planctomycetota bacterium]|nr:polysaccharide deacetylase family protein [Planctomycetota bacterium]